MAVSLADFDPQVIAQYSLIHAIPDDDRRKGRYFDRRIRELRPGIEEAEVVLGEYAIFEEMEKRRMERPVEYTAPELAYQAVRERRDEETH